MILSDKRPIVITGHEKTEVDILLDSIENAKTDDIAGFYYTCGSLQGIPTVISFCHIGCCNASAATALACEKYHPSVILSQGTAGGHDPALHQRDIVIGENLYNVSAVNYPHRDAGQGLYEGDLLYRDGERYDGWNGKWIQKALLESDARLVSLCESVPYAKGRLCRGTLASSDEWNRGLDRIATRFQAIHSSGEEMESFYIGQIAGAFAVPFLALRIISNSEPNGEEFIPETAHDLQRYILSLFASENFRAHYETIS